MSGLGSRRELTGYTDAWSVAPGDRVQVMVSTTEPSYEVDLVRLRHGDDRPGAPGLREAEVTPTSGPWPGRVQVARAGSCVVVPPSPRVGRLVGFTVQLWVWPTRPCADRDQGLLSTMTSARTAGWAVVIDGQGRLALRIGDGTGLTGAAAPCPLWERTWYFVCIGFDPARGTVRAIQQAVGTCAADPSSSAWETTLDRRPAEVPGELLIGAVARATGAGARTWGLGHFDGKIEAPALFDGPLGAEQMEALAGGSPAAADPRALVAAWDLGAEPAGTRVVDLGPVGLHGATVNAPARLVTGHAWTDAAGSPVSDPRGYGAMHFHADDLDDARWEPDLSLALPPDLASGVYAVRTTAGDLVDRFPLFVRPPRGTASADVALLLPTFTYLAYGNSRVQLRTDFGRSGLIGRPTRPDPLDLWLREHPELGLSLYDSHDDGSGSCYASRLRPLTNLRPHHLNWMTGSPRHFGADLYIVDWLEEIGIRYDVLTDEDLHSAGAGLLKPYRAVLTGTHPEYATDAMLTALEEYTTGGGRLLCLGGNCFYWVTSTDAKRPHLIEVRRGHGGTRPWESEPGEQYHSMNGETGGLWRYRGRPPNRLLGTGFTAQGWDERARGYRRTAASLETRYSWIFDGIGVDEVIGDFGLVMDGAAGDEIDRADATCGTPPDTVVLASSEGHSDYYRLAVEDVLSMGPGLTGTTDPRIRADLAYRETGSGGAVLTVSSICWAGSLSHAGYRNNVSQLTRNVVEGFLLERLPGSEGG